VNYSPKLWYIEVLLIVILLHVISNDVTAITFICNSSLRDFCTGFACQDKNFKTCFWSPTFKANLEDYLLAFNYTCKWTNNKFTIYYFNNSLPLKKCNRNFRIYSTTKRKRGPFTLDNEYYPPITGEAGWTDFQTPQPHPFGTTFIIMIKLIKTKRKPIIGVKTNNFIIIKTNYSHHILDE